MSSTDKYTVADCYFNDGVTDKYGRKHAQGSHDINRNSAKYNDDGSKSAWHRKVRTRRKGYARFRKEKEAGKTTFHRSYKVRRNGRTVYAIDAHVRNDGTILRCTGFSDSPRREPTSALGKACAK